MMTTDIDALYSKPGLYVVAMPAGFFIVEVVEGGICYQLTPDTLRLDGELSREGWFLPNILGIIGPFARHPSTLPVQAPPQEKAND